MPAAVRNGSTEIGSLINQYPQDIALKGVRLDVALGGFGCYCYRGYSKEANST
ncbi:hypothetical protein PTT_10891 [Pyrenophora teres f. teres 0-1]|uniref:Uncharacterized protein n=1 Tax=Pyrenophora teres f. teres (strain 0-1) TaxID=861557 RepID=E3RQB2_PYRTT|nr:hypothetical protein PTT_10891 [Pyrenophora teres f. teres 0-1]